MHLNIQGQQWLLRHKNLQQIKKIVKFKTEWNHPTIYYYMY